MDLGLRVVFLCSSDLLALRTYYPKGMIKTSCFDLDAFSQNIMKLLEDRQLYLKLKEDAASWAREWDWDKRANYIFDKIFKDISSIRKCLQFIIGLKDSPAVS